LQQTYGTMRVLPYIEFVVHCHNLKAGGTPVATKQISETRANLGANREEVQQCPACSGSISRDLLIKYECKYTHARIAPQDGRLLARRQLPLGRPDLSL